MASFHLVNFVNAFYKICVIVSPVGICMYLSSELEVLKGIRSFVASMSRETLLIFIFGGSINIGNVIL